ncbi:hypothetical protein PO878_18965 [Iamia majanohamensis]|uniref:Uncharacterized protein n=1 Tax=Iamia majanohamensis TaxID=467976 RepID=A0AAE9Y935_9ACTN|nr:hypothetical protein [Iamia majanohamensis]WCO66584.1 hypothetical protein PO878_18965 [Iamia majanohamensis]
MRNPLRRKSRWQRVAAPAVRLARGRGGKVATRTAGVAAAAAAAVAASAAATAARDES